MRLARIQKFYYRVKDKIAHCELETFRDEHGRSVIVATEVASNYGGPDVGSNLDAFLTAARQELEIEPDEAFRFFVRWTKLSYVPENEEGVETSEITFRGYRPWFTNVEESEWRRIYKTRSQPLRAWKKRTSSLAPETSG